MAGPAGGRRRSGPTQGDDLRFDLEIDFQTALFGGEKRIRITHLEGCGTCSGDGIAPGASVNTCAECGGRGVTVQTVNTIMGRLQQQARAQLLRAQIPPHAIPSRAQFAPRRRTILRAAAPPC